MSAREFSDWIEFYKAYPFDDRHRFHRPAAMVASSLGGGDVQARLDWLCPEPVPEGLTDVDVSIMRAFGVRK